VRKLVTSRDVDLIQLYILFIYFNGRIEEYTGVYGVHPTRYFYLWRIAYEKVMIYGYTDISTVVHPIGQ
jgi:hypothetical protein